MTLLEQYREQAMAAFIADADSDMTADEKRTYAESEVCENIGIVLGYYTLSQLMAYVVTGRITHRYDGGCPYVGELNSRAPWGCIDDGCIACLIQRDWLDSVLGSAA